MWSLLFVILMFVVFGKILKFAIRAAWNITKITLFLVMLPVILIGLVLGGLLVLALPALVVIGIVAFCVLRD